MPTLIPGCNKCMLFFSAGIVPENPKLKIVELTL
jgi:hypothetical protein